MRGLVTDRHVYLRNFTPDRWPSGNPETGYLDTDGGATKSLILREHRVHRDDPFWQVCFGLRPGEELYDLTTDPGCLRNLAAEPAHSRTREQLARRLDRRLRREGDPRVSGMGDVFDRYPHAQPGHTNFHARYLQGESLKTGWVEPTDFESSP